MSEQNDYHAMRQLTDAEMALQEKSQEAFVESWVKAFLRFPTENNKKGLIERLTDYQTAWMMGRIRPDVVVDLQKSEA